MSVALQRTAILLGLLIVTLPPAVWGALDEAVLADLRSRDAITIVITDSGLGGLSVVADAEAKLRQWGVYAEVELVFYNALFTGEGGYNSLPGARTRSASSAGRSRTCRSATPRTSFSSPATPCRSCTTTRSSPPRRGRPSSASSRAEST